MVIITVIDGLIKPQQSHLGESLWRVLFLHVLLLNSDLFLLLLVVSQSEGEANTAANQDNSQWDQKDDCSSRHFVHDGVVSLGESDHGFGGVHTEYDVVVGHEDLAKDYINLVFGAAVEVGIRFANYLELTGLTSRVLFVRS